MSFPRYPKYKPSGVEWLGEVPEHWDVQPFKWHVERNDGGVWGQDPTGVDDTVVLRSTEQTVDGHWRIEDPAHRQLNRDEVLAAMLLEGDLLVTKSSGSSLHIGKTTLVSTEIAAMKCCYSNFMQRIRTAQSFRPELAWYVLNSELARRQFDLLSNSTTGLANLNGNLIGQLIVSAPPVPEQIAIAAFLDRETAKIDALIAEQEKLIELLAEKRQAVISHAVTKGLNPAAPLKPSGVEWLGDVPAHWEVVPVASIAQIVNGYPFDSEMFDSAEGTPLVRIRDLGRDSTEARFRGRSIAAAEITNADVLIGMDGDFNVGRWHGNGTALLNQRMCCVRAANAMQTRLLEYALPTPLRLINAVTYATTVKHLASSQVGKTRVAVPTQTELESIISFLDHETAKIDVLVAEAEKAIDLLRERRSALISAAVTGQIDVRNAVPEPVA